MRYAHPIIRPATIALAAGLLLAACSNPTSGRYNVQDVGRVIETSQGTVVTSRVVDVQGGENSGVGALAGGAAGATVGGVAIGSGNGSVLAAVIGGLIGAGAGYLAEESGKSREGIEYVIRTDDGRIVTLVQNRDGEEEPIPSESPVLIQYGADYTRVVELPSDLDATGASGGAAGPEWQNPDLIPEQRQTSPLEQQDQQ